MIRKSFFIFLLLIPVCAITAFAQQDSANKAERQSFAFVLGEGSYLGIQTQEITRDNFGKFNLREVRGVAIEKVLENSPAAQAGLQSGDVILKFNGEAVTGTRKLMRLIAEVAPDHKAELLISRGGNEREITVTVGKRPVPTLENGAFPMNFPRVPPPQGRVVPSIPFPPPSGGSDSSTQVFTVPAVPPSVFREGEGMSIYFGTSRQIGVSVSSLTKQLGEHFGVAEGKGLLVNSVIENSPAAKAGLRAGDVITEVDGKEVKSNVDLIRAIGEKKEGEAVNLTIIRDKNRQTISVVPEKMKGALSALEELKNFEGEFPKMNIQPMNIQPMPKIDVAPFITPGDIFIPSRVL